MAPQMMYQSIQVQGTTPLLTITTATMVGTQPLPILIQKPVSGKIHTIIQLV